MGLSKYTRAIVRRKHLDQETIGESKLDRVLTVFDLTALGVGATLGAGVYVLTGAVAKETSGPSVIIAFLIAALTSILSGLCYAEFGARVPKAGSGYVYSYVTVGELVAFIIGWNLVLSYVIGAASVARAWTANFDALVNKTIENYMRECCTMKVPGLAEFPDLFSFFIVMVLTALIAFGVKEFAMVNKVFTVLNIFVILFVVIAGMTQADLHNWAWTVEEIEAYVRNGSLIGANITDAMSARALSAAVNTSSSATTAAAATTVAAGTTLDLSVYGQGGFFPFGIAGLVSGTATCFYAFVGFDCIATTGEEAINPQKSIPLGIVFSLAVCCVAYLGISSTLTLMQPYFLLDKNAPLPYAFTYVGLSWAQYPVSVGAICALSTSLLGAMFPMPRIIYAMAVDGLLFKFLAKVHDRTKTPLIATFISGTFAGIMAVFFDLKELVDLMSIGTLAAYTLVAASVLLLRYQPDAQADVPVPTEDKDGDSVKGKSHRFRIAHLCRPPTSLPTLHTSRIVNWATIATSLAIIAFSILATLTAESGWNWLSIIIACVCMIVVIGCLLFTWCQPESTKPLSFKVPLVPFVPILNMLVNIYLMVSLPPGTWYKMGIWMAAGGAIYFFYGVGHSAEAKPNIKDKEQLLEGKKRREGSLSSRCEGTNV